jgi:NTF2 fold immunity protein
LNVIREELARSLVERQTPPIVPEEMESALEVPEAGVVPDADTAKRIAEGVWIPQYGAGTVARQAPIKAELKFNVWIVTGSSSTEAPLFAFILQTDGRILSLGGPTKR